MLKQRVLGKTGIIAGEVGLGCEGFADMSREECIQVLDLAIGKGANYIDLYAPSPLIRNNISIAIAGRREQVIIQGHIGTIWEDGQYLRTRDPEKTKLSFEDLLTRLKTDYIDVGMIHYCDAQADYDRILNGGLMEYAKELKAGGVILHIGISSHNPLIAKQAVESGLIDVLMFSVNPCYDMMPADESCDPLFMDSSYDRDIIGMDKDRQELYELCERAGVPIIVMKTYAGGVLLDAAQSPFGAAMSPAQCISYCLSRPGVAVALAGGHSYDEFAAAFAYAKASESEKDFSSILKTNPRYSFTGHCMYCGHCAPCTVGISIADVNKFLDLCEAQGRVIETAREHYLALSHHAGECIQCGACESNCPFAVNIIQKMGRAAELFGK